MAIVLPHRKAIVFPKPKDEHYQILKGVFPMKQATLVDGDILAIPHCRDSLTMLENMGINIDGCELIEHYYDFPTSVEGHSMWWWQVETSKFFTKHKRAFCTSTPRTGKTLGTCGGIDFLQKHGGQRAAIIIAPLTVAANGEWAKTFRDWFPDKKVVLVHKNREEELNTPADIYLINPDGFKTTISDGRTVAELVKEKVDKGSITIGVIDELTEFGNMKSQRWIAVNDAFENLEYFWGLTGTPGKPEKVYAQVRLVNPNNVPSYFGKWRDMTEEKVSQFKWRPKEGHEEIIKKAMSPCIRYDKKQLMEIPEPQVVREVAELSGQQRALTLELIEQLQAAVGGEEVEASTASTLALKLLQVSNGVVKGSEGTVRLDCAPKLEKLEEWLRKTDRKKVIFSNFIAVNDMLVEEVTKMGFTVKKVDGTVTGIKRSNVLHDFLEEKDPHVLICHPRTTAFGVELASADTIICYGPPMAGAFMYQQMFERLSSSRQTAKETFIVHLAAGSQDTISFANLAQGVSLERNIVDIFTENLL